MAYTINYFYLKFLDKIDKEGSDIISVPQVMELLESETYNYIKQTVKYNENTGEIRDSIKALSKPLGMNLTQNLNNTEEMIATFPSDYLYLETVKILIPNVDVRKVTILRKGALDINQRNPNKYGTEEYPNVILYQDYLAVYTGATNANKVTGFYISKPIFGDPEGNVETEIVVNLPDVTVEEILNLMVSSFHERNADQRFQLSHIREQGFGKVNK